jgi:hypothetical protein
MLEPFAIVLQRHVLRAMIARSAMMVLMVPVVRAGLAFLHQDLATQLQGDVQLSRCSQGPNSLHFHVALET